MIDTPTIGSHNNQPRSLGGVMIAAVATLAISVAVSVVAISFDIHRLSVISRILSDASAGNLIRFGSDLAAAHTSDNQTSVIAVAELVALIVAAGCFIAWFHRAYRNLPRLGATSVRYRPGWAIGGWFVPILNFWRPKQIVNDIWRGSDPSHGDEQPSWSEPVAPLLWFWWAAWLLTGILNRASAHEWGHAVSAHALQSATRLDIASEVVSILAAGLAIAVVYRLTKRQRERTLACQATTSPIRKT